MRGMSTPSVVIAGDQQRRFTPLAMIFKNRNAIWIATE